MWLMYDSNALYLGARLSERNPSVIMCRSLERDSHSPDQDAIGIVLDTLNDNRTAYSFIVTPAGCRTDLAVANDAESRGRAWNTDWNAFWDAATSQDEGGWSAEMRIPFSSLRFRSNHGVIQMGLILWRYLARNKEFDVFPAIPNNWRYSAYKPSQALDTDFLGIEEQHPLYIRPYVAAGVSQQNELIPLLSAYSIQNSWVRDLGLDLKYNLAGNLILDATLNTDFAQVEADDQQINLTRFSLFFPEKRVFFQERADLFNFNLPGGPQVLFHSRTIGIVNDREVPIVGGLRLTGRMGNWEIGLLEMQTAQSRSDEGIIPAENFGVLRLRRQVFGNDSYLGGMLTTRTDFEGRYNLLFAADLNAQLEGDHYMWLKLAQSVEPGTLLTQSRMGTMAFYSHVNRGFNYGISAMHLGSQFQSGLGFIFRNGINRIGSRLGYVWHPKSSRLIQNHGLTNRAEIIWSLASGKYDTIKYTFNWAFLFRSGATAEFSMKLTREWIVDPFEVGEVRIDHGEYQSLVGEAKYKTSSGHPFQLGLEAQGGGYYGGRQIGATVSPQWTMSRYLTLMLDYNFSHASLSNGIYNAHVARFRIRSAFNRALSLGAFIQYSTDEHQILTNIRLRYNPSEGVDFYLVYNEGTNTRLDRLSPSLPRLSGRTILLKYTYTFIR